MALTGWKDWLLVIVAGNCMGTGNLLLKKSRLVMDSPSLLKFLTSIWFLSALLLFITSLLLFAKALDRLPVSVALPVFQGMVLISVNLFAVWLLKEQLTLNQIVAVGVIFSGIIIMTR